MKSKQIFRDFWWPGKLQIKEYIENLEEKNL